MLLCLSEQGVRGGKQVGKRAGKRARKQAGKWPYQSAGTLASDLTIASASSFKKRIFGIFDRVPVIGVTRD